MLTFAALVTLLVGLVYVIDAGNDFVNGRAWERGAALAGVYLALFIGFYAAKVLVP